MGLIMKNGVPYAIGSEIPEGGTKGQVLAKASDIDGDFKWTNGGSGGGVVSGFPSGGVKGDIIVKQSSADGDVKWTPLNVSEWGVARTGVATVTFNNSKWSSSATVDVSEFGFSSGTDYDVVVQPTTGGTATPWGNAIAYINADKGAASFSVSSVTMEDSLSGTVNIKYTIFAKGYGTTVDGGGGSGETPTLDAVLKKGNETDNSARFTGTDSSTEISNSGAYMTGIGAEGMRQFSISQDRISAVDNLVGTITPKFVVPFEPSGEDQVAMSDAVKESFKKALDITNDTFVFDVDSDQFTEDTENPDGKHYGMTITSPTYDELLAMLQTDKFVYARLLYNSGNAYETMQLFHNGNSIYGRYFDVEFPKKRLMFASAYVNKRNNDTTYFGTSQDYISGGTVDQAYDATSTNAQSGAAVAEAVAAAAYDDTALSGKVTDLESAVGDASALSTIATDLSAAVNELKSGIDALGEPFRVKQWATNTLNVEIPYCTEDITNGNIPKMVYSIDDVEGADYQIVGMIAYEVFDAASGGNRINCFPVCQFTGNGQKELSVRWTCMGTTRKTAKRINAWVLLKHR